MKTSPISYYHSRAVAFLNKELIQCIKKLGVNVAIQPCAVISEFTAWSATERLGAKRARWLYPIKTLIKEGILFSATDNINLDRCLWKPKTLI